MLAYNRMHLLEHLESHVSDWLKVFILWPDKSAINLAWGCWASGVPSSVRSQAVVALCLMCTVRRYSAFMGLCIVFIIIAAYSLFAPAWAAVSLASCIVSLDRGVFSDLL